MVGDIKYGVGACGKACFICRLHGEGCLGCVGELEKHPEIDCVFYDCAKDKNVPACLQCSEYPCKLHIGVSGLYCPIYRERTRRFGIRQRERPGSDDRRKQEKKGNRYWRLFQGIISRRGRYQSLG